MKAVIYARFSCSKQREASIDDQLRVCREWALDNGHEVIGEYCDKAVSGRTDDRPSFQSMIANAGESQLVIVYMMDRFSRDMYDAPYYKWLLREKGVKVVSATEPMAEGAEALLLEKIYEGLAAVESEHISKRTKRGMEGNALKCKNNGVRVYGYRFSEDGGYEVDPEQAEVVKEVFQRRLNGDNANMIATAMAARGVRTYTGRPCSHTMVTNMLRCEKYTGVYIWGDVRVEGGMPKIIEPETFHSVKAIRPRRTTKHEYILSGKLVHSCGRAYQGRSANGNGGLYFYYTCPDCLDSVNAKALEDRISGSIRELLDNRGEAVKIASRAIEYMGSGDIEGKREKALERERKARESIKRLVSLAELGDVPDLKEAIERQKAIAAGAHAEYESYSMNLSVDDFADFLQFGATLDDKRLIVAFVSQALVDDNHVTVLLNHDIKGEPAHIDIELVRKDCSWLPLYHGARTFISVSQFILIRFAA